jgi:hypothetical protein
LIISGQDYMKPGSVHSIDGIENLERIEEFEFAYQDLFKLPDMSSLRNLRRLHIEKCVHLEPIDFKKIPEGVLSLTLWNINLKNLDGIERLENLETLWIGDNPRLTSLSNLNEIETLKELDIAFCDNLPADELFNLYHIKTLRILYDQYPAEVVKVLERRGIEVLQL